MRKHGYFSSELLADSYVMKVQEAQEASKRFFFTCISSSDCRKQFVGDANTMERFREAVRVLSVNAKLVPIRETAREVLQQFSFPNQILKVCFLGFFFSCFEISHG